MNISEELANRVYTALVVTIHSPDDYRRWSFLYAMVVAKLTEYQIDSRLGPGTKLHNKWKTVPPKVVCPDPDSEIMVKAANTLIVEAIRPKKIAIRKVSQQTEIPVQRL